MRDLSFPHPRFLEALDYAVQFTRESANTTPRDESPSSTCHLRSSGTRNSFAGGESRGVIVSKPVDESRMRQARTDVQGGVRKCRTWRPATPEQARALMALRGLVGPLRAPEVARQLDWTLKKARRWVDFFRAKGLLAEGAGGFAWADRDAAGTELTRRTA